LIALKQSKKDLTWTLTNQFQVTFSKVRPKTILNKKIESPQPPEESRVEQMLELTLSTTDKEAIIQNLQISCSIRATLKFTIYRIGKIALAALTSRINSFNSTNSK
jgi:hypothetical protein